MKYPEKPNGEECFVSLALERKLPLFCLVGPPTLDPASPVLFFLTFPCLNCGMDMWDNLI